MKRGCADGHILNVIKAEDRRTDAADARTQQADIADRETDPMRTTTRSAAPARTPQGPRSNHGTKPEANEDQSTKEEKAITNHKLQQKMGPLTGLKVLDFSRLLPGPLSTHLLVRLGASVVKIEAPSQDYVRDIPPLIR